jgi:hypothetical protein
MLRILGTCKLVITTNINLRLYHVSIFCYSLFVYYLVPCVLDVRVVRKVAGHMMP